MIQKVKFHEITNWYPVDFFSILPLIFIAVQFLEKRSKAFEPTYSYTMEKVCLYFHPYRFFLALPVGLQVLSVALPLESFLMYCHQGMFPLQGYFLLPEAAKSRHNIRTINVSISARHPCLGNRLNSLTDYIFVCLPLAFTQQFLRCPSYFHIVTGLCDFQLSHIV